MTLNLWCSLLGVAILSMVGMAVVFARLISGQNKRFTSLIFDLNQEHSRNIARAMVVLKANNAVEAVQAEAQSRESELRLKNLQDAMAETSAVQEKKQAESVPRMAKTADGREIDLRDWEFV